MVTKASNAGQGQELCPECRVNQVEAPFDYCGLCEMLASYYKEKVATADLLKENARFNEEFERWRANLTWAQMVQMRDTYWKKKQKRAASTRTR